jgi:hypothetical protein
MRNLIIKAKPFTLASYQPMECIAIDTMGPLTETQGYTHILVVIDCFTRFIELFPLKTLEAQEASKCINQHCGRYGTPDLVISDMGSQFANQTVDTLLTLLQAKGIKSTPYSKQENGLVERANKEVLRHLRALVFTSRVEADWLDCLPLVQRIINTTPHSSIGVSPAELLFGNAVKLEQNMYKLSDENSEESAAANNNITNNLNTREWVDKMLSKQAMLIATAQDLQKQKDDMHMQSKVADEYTEYPMNSYVLVKYPPSAMRNKAPSKLLTPWRGPLRVINSIGSKYTLQDLVTGKTEDVHVSLLKPFIYEEAHTDPATVALADKGMFWVERILRHRGNPRGPKGQLSFEVKWIGHPNPTWEPWKNVIHNIKLHEYLSQNNLQMLIPLQHRQQQTNNEASSYSSTSANATSNTTNNQENNDKEQSKKLKKTVTYADDV